MKVFREPLKHNKKLVPYAKALRRNMTPEERRLWYNFLRDYPIRFQRQKVLLQFIADFYCSRAGLVIEVDGFQHYAPENRRHDAARTEALSVFGLRVIRFTNDQVNRHFSAVCAEIHRVVEERIREREAQKTGE